MVQPRELIWAVRPSQAAQEAHMLSKAILAGQVALVIVLGSAVLRSQQPPAAPTPSVPRDFPVIMRQNVVAGTTAVGTKVQAKLVIATLVDNVVIPRDAMLSGE